MFREEDVYAYGGAKPLGDGDVLEEARHWKQDLSVHGVTTLPFHSLIYDFI